MSKKRALKFETGIEARGAAVYLELLAHAIREGHLNLKDSSDPVKELSLDVGGTLDLKIAARSNAKKGKSELELSLVWRSGELPESGEGELFITSGAMPEPAPDPEEHEHSGEEQGFPAE